MTDDKLTEASSPTTLAERLSVLSVDVDREVQRLVAGNPSVSRKVALELCEHFPDEFLANPSFALWSLEDPLLLTRLSVRAVQALLQAPTLTTEHLHILAVHPSGNVRTLVLASPLATAATFELASQPWPRLDTPAFQLALARNPRTPVHLLESLLDTSVDQGSIAANPATPDYLRRAILDETPATLPRPLLEQLMPPDRLDALRDRRPVVRVLLAADPDTAPWMLGRLARDPEADVRGAVVRNPHTPTASLRALCHDRSAMVSHEAGRRLQSRLVRP